MGPDQAPGREAEPERTPRDPPGRSELRHAVPLAVAAAMVGVANLLTTVFSAHVLSTRGYGTVIVLLSLFLVVATPAGSALLVGVVRRVSAWEATGHLGRLRSWVARVHRAGEVSLLGLAVLMALLRWPIAHALSLPNANGVAEMLTAGGVWVLVSIDRGLLQARRDYFDLSVNLVIEAVMRLVLTVGLAAELGVEGAALGVLVAELTTVTHARISATRALARPAGPPDAVEEAAELSVEAAGGAMPVAVHGGRDLAADVLAALGSLLLLAVLQNSDVIVLGARSPHHAGSYAAISVPAKALVFGALVLINYLLPEAAIRHQAGGHALRQLGYTFAVLAVPCAALLGLSVVVPRHLLSAVFGHKLTAAAPAFASLVLGMVLLSVTLVLSIYLLGIGWRWVMAVLAVGAGALVGVTWAAHGAYLATAHADLAVQAGLLAVLLVCFAVVHRRSTRHRAGGATLGAAP